MNRNQKIALGCGGAGCLGLIVLAIAGGLFWYFASSSSTNRNRNYNFNINSNTNRSNSNANLNSNSSTPSSSISSDDKHRLFQAAGMTKDSALIKRVLQKLGFMNESGVTSSDYEAFVKEHFTWALKNTQFVMSVNSEEKARAYVNEHLD
jgi:hypothetical protein